MVSTSVNKVAVGDYNPAVWARGSTGSRCGERRRATWPTRSRVNEAQADDAAWRPIHAGLVRSAEQQAELDAEQLVLLREAERLRIWEPLGMVNMLDYMERVLAIKPETARKRLRVARALGELPRLSQALREGVLSYSAVKELSHVATRDTEQAWLEAATDRSLREVEELVAGHARGDLPGDPPDPELRLRSLRFEVTPSTFALVRQAQHALTEAHGRRPEPDEVLAAMSTALLERLSGPSSDDSAEAVAGTEAGEAGDAPVNGTAAGRRDDSGRARFQIAMIVCELCKQGWQEGAGVRVAVDAATVERAHCDAQHLGSLHADRPARAYQDPPPSVIRFVRLRDGNRCQTPGCRSTFGLEVHHIDHREHGGSHHPSNLTLRCAACHAAHHAGLLTIRGTAPDRLITERHEPIRPRAAARRSREEDEEDPVEDDARQALITLGFRPGIARAAVAEAMGHVAHGASLQDVIREALRRCPKPSS